MDININIDRGGAVIGTLEEAAAPIRWPGNETAPEEGLVAMAKYEASHFFRYGIKQVVKLNESDETGTIIARAEYANSNDQYLIRYRAGDGCQTEAWWSEDAIRAA